MIPENLTIVRLKLGYKYKTDFTIALELKNSSYISNLESGAQPISDEFLNRLCAHFPKVNKDFIISGTGQPFKDDTVQAPTSSLDRLTIARDYLFDLFNELSPERQQEILMLARDLLERQQDKKNGETSGSDGESCPVGLEVNSGRKVA